MRSATQPYCNTVEYGCVSLRMRFFSQNFGTIKRILPGSSSPSHREGPGIEVGHHHGIKSFELPLWKSHFFQLNDVILMKQKCLCCEYPVYRFSAQKSSNSLLLKHCSRYHRIPNDMFLEYSNDIFH